MNQNLLVLRCDVSAPAELAAEDRAERLIWGRFPGAGPGLGIGALMDIADGFGVKMTFFLGPPDTAQTGDSIARAARKILDRGHDLQPFSDGSRLSGLPDVHFEEFDSAEGMHDRLRGIGPLGDGANTVCLRFRSWSLLHRDEQGIPVYKGQEHANRLREFFRYIPVETQVITVSELIGELQRGADRS
jgi:hypothetical protein